jgi:hypothetical protein
MIDVANNSGCTVRIIVKLKPEQYDELMRHVREIGSTMSAFFRESAVKAMKNDHSDGTAAAVRISKYCSAPPGNGGSRRRRGSP